MWYFENPFTKKKQEQSRAAEPARVEPAPQSVPSAVVSPEPIIAPAPIAATPAPNMNFDPAPQNEFPDAHG